MLTTSSSLILSPSANPAPRTSRGGPGSNHVSPPPATTLVEANISPPCPSVFVPLWFPLAQHRCRRDLCKPCAGTKHPSSESPQAHRRTEMKGQSSSKWPPKLCPPPPCPSSLPCFPASLGRSGTPTTLSPLAPLQLRRPSSLPLPSRSPPDGLPSSAGPGAWTVRCALRCSHHLSPSPLLHKSPRFLNSAFPYLPPPQECDFHKDEDVGVCFLTEVAPDLQSGGGATVAQLVKRLRLGS